MSATNFPLNVISPKALEKQLKLVEGRIAVLQSEMTELDRIKNACLVLMGTAVTATPVESAEAAAITKNRKKKSTEDEEGEEEVDVISPSEVMASEATAAH